MAIGDEAANRGRVELRIARGEALVRAVDEHVVAARLERGRDGVPLRGRRVDARRVVRARVQQEDRAGRRGLNVGEVAL